MESLLVRSNTLLTRGKVQLDNCAEQPIFPPNKRHNKVLLCAYVCLSTNKLLTHSVVSQSIHLRFPLSWGFLEWKKFWNFEEKNLLFGPIGKQVFSLQSISSSNILIIFFFSSYLIDNVFYWAFLLPIYDMFHSIHPIHNIYLVPFVVQIQKDHWELSVKCILL